jgi:hypothetical protein
MYCCTAIAVHCPGTHLFVGCPLSKRLLRLEPTRRGESPSPFVALASGRAYHFRALIILVGLIIAMGDFLALAFTTFLKGRRVVLFAPSIFWFCCRGQPRNEERERSFVSTPCPKVVSFHHCLHLLQRKRERGILVCCNLVCCRYLLVQRLGVCRLSSSSFLACLF